MAHVPLLPIGKPAAFVREGTQVARELLGGSSMSSALGGVR